MSDQESLALQRILKRERRARKTAESVLETRSLELYEASEKLKALAANLETRVKERTAELENALILAEAGEESKSAFLANMSHEIRTPLNGIIGMNNLLLGEQLSAQQVHYAESVQESAELLLRLINDILDFSKIEAGKFQMEIIDFSILEVMDSMAEMFQVKAFNKGIELNVIYDSNLPHKVKGDPSRLKQVLLNLLDNAIKFTPSGSVTFRVQVMNTSNEVITLMFQIEDTGIGMDEASLETLFQPFTQAERSISRRFGGTGLGLAIANDLIRMMGGEIHVESELSKGSAFTVSIPYPISEVDDPFDNLFSSKGIECRLTVAAKLQKESLKSMLEVEGIDKIEEMPFSDIQESAVALTGKDPVLWVFSCDGMRGDELEGFVTTLTSLPAIVRPLVYVHQSTPKIRNLFEDIQTLKLPINRYLLNRSICAIMGIEYRGAKFQMQSNEKLKDLDLSKIHVLLAEDNVINQVVSREMLTKFGAQVDIAGNGYEVIQMLELISYDLILMDIQMPELGGIEACERIRSQGNRVPIIALTANAMKGDRERFLDVGMDDYLSKPLMINELAEVLLRLFSDQKGVLSDSIEKERPTDKSMVMDLDVLIKTLGGNRAMAEEVIEEFCNQCQDLVSKGFELIKNKEWSSASSIFHRLSGSAFAIRAEELANAAVAMEDHLTTNPGSSDELLANLNRFKDAKRRFDENAEKQGWVLNK